MGSSTTQPGVVAAPRPPSPAVLPALDTAPSAAAPPRLSPPSPADDLSRTPSAATFDTDLEKGRARRVVTSIDDEADQKARRCLRDAAIWPQRDHWVRKARQDKKHRAWCSWLAGLSKRNRLLVHILFGLLIIGAAVGIGVGISKPLGAGIWKPPRSH